MMKIKCMQCIEGKPTKEKIKTGECTVEGCNSFAQKYRPKTNLPKWMVAK